MTPTIVDVSHRMQPVMPSTVKILLPDNYAAHARVWRADTPRGVVLCFHGIQSHGGWYELSGAHLAGAGFSVVMPDRRGSGVNAIPRGHFTSLEQCMEDTLTLLDETMRLARTDRVHVVGISWGGKQAVLLAQERPRNIATVTLVAPGLFPRVDLTPSEKFGVGIAMINDRKRLFDIPLNDAAYFTGNPERIRFVEEDRLKLQRVSASFLLTSRRLDKHLRRFAQADWRGPVHLVLAGHDRIIDNARTRGWFESLPSHDKLLREYPDSHHTLEFDADPIPFLNDMTNWLIERS